MVPTKYENIMIVLFFGYDFILPQIFVFVNRGVVINEVKLGGA